MQQKILLVDDREDNLLSIETILETDGYQLVKANSGRQALKILLKEFDFALILMDVKMPNLNGFETASLIYEREKLKHIPIIFITANNYGDENIFKGYKAGAVDYIYKPINPDLLRAKVSVFIELYKKNHQLLAQEKKLIAINKNLENEIRERKISEQKIHNLNSQLLENIAQLEEANKELDRFAFMASHDLQEPLRKIQTYSNRIIEKVGDNLPESVVDYLSRIQNASRRMKKLIEDLLSFSHTTSSVYTPETIDLNALVEEVRAMLQEKIDEKKAVIEAEPLPVVHAVPVQFQQLFVNLLSNSIKYSKPEVPPKIRIASDIVPGHIIGGQQGIYHDRQYHHIRVEDNGIGFDQNFSHKIFELFQRLHGRNEYSGTGIGLAICKKILQNHQGYITAEGRPGEGSVFSIYIPCIHNRHVN